MLSFLIIYFHDVATDQFCFSGVNTWKINIRRMETHTVLHRILLV